MIRKNNYVTRNPSTSSSCKESDYHSSSNSQSYSYSRSITESSSEENFKLVSSRAGHADKWKPNNERQKQIMERAKSLAVAEYSQSRKKRKKEKQSGSSSKAADICRRRWKFYESLISEEIQNIEVIVQNTRTELLKLQQDNSRLLSKITQIGDQLWQPASQLFDSLFFPATERCQIETIDEYLDNQFMFVTESNCSPRSDFYPLDRSSEIEDQLFDLDDLGDSNPRYLGQAIVVEGSSSYSDQDGSIL